MTLQLTLMLDPENGGVNVHDSSCGADFIVTRRTADLALQPLMGLLPERRAGTDRDCGSGSASGRTLVS